ncbi:MAG: hypothetical protein Q8730_02405, partial [Sweet potato little leaf phytoplasma]|nr:hypothetical protein [Sweet potato little leaf phytoplasma]
MVALVASMAFSISFASDPSPLQDYCVAIDDIKDGGIDIVLNRQIFPQIYYINSNAMTFENHINEMDQLLNDPVYVSF